MNRWETHVSFFLFCLLTRLLDTFLFLLLLLPRNTKSSFSTSAMESSIPRGTLCSHHVHSHAGTNPHITNIFQVSNTAQNNPVELSKGACFRGCGMGPWAMKNTHVWRNIINIQYVRISQMRVILEGLNIIKWPVLLLTLTVWNTLSISKLNSKSDWPGLAPVKYQCKYGKVKCITAHLF